MLQLITLKDIIGVSPQLVLLAVALLILMCSVFSRRMKDSSYWMAQGGLLLAIVLLTSIHHFTNDVLFQGGLVLDHLSYILQLAIFATVFMVFLYSRRYLKHTAIAQPEYYFLALMAVIGMTLLSSAHHLLVLYLSLELFSLPLYAMVAMRRDDPRCIEAAIKYFVMGAAASGLLLYGISLYFGATSSLGMGQLAQHISHIPHRFDLLLDLGLLFILAGSLFKLGAVPFHAWVPDTYAGAPVCATLFISTAPKLAAFALLLRLVVYASHALLIDWQLVMIVVAVLSMFLGNFVAIVQTNLKRMLAYSSIAHIGYMLLGMLCGTTQGSQAALFYMLSYVLMALAAFGFITLLSSQGRELESISDLSGLNQRNPWLAFLVMIVMFSLAGIPPLLGFIAKVAVLEALIQVHLVWLASLALVFAVVGSYYYIRVVKVMYFDADQRQADVKQSTKSTELARLQIAALPADGSLALSLNSLAIVFLGVFPGILFHLCHLAIF